MEEFFVHKCVTANVLPAPEDVAGAQSSSTSTWSQHARCEFVVVQENQHTHGASRAVLAAIVGLTLQSRKTSAVLLFTLDTLTLAASARASDKLVHVDYAHDTALLRASLLSASSSTAPPHQSLLSRLQTDVDAQLAAVAVSSNVQQRSVVIVVDALHVLLAHHSLRELLLFVQQLRASPLVGCVVARFSASVAAAVDAGAAQRAFAAASTAVALVETPASLASYAILAKERRRDVPKHLHGLVLLLRHKKNGRSSESVDYFHVHGDRLQFVSTTAATAAAATASAKRSSNDKNNTVAKPALDNETNRRDPVPVTAIGPTPTALLPVRQEDVSFNLSISVEEQLAKSRVQLPYMHQGHHEHQAAPLSAAAATTSESSSSNRNSSSSGPTNLFFIDDDDPDWDDDDLDDDLDI